MCSCKHASNSNEEYDHCFQVEETESELFDNLLRCAFLLEGEPLVFFSRVIDSMKVNVKVAQLCPTLCNPMDHTALEILQARIQDCSLSLLQGIFPTQVSSPTLPHCRLILYQLSHRGSPTSIEVCTEPCTFFFINSLTLIAG